MIKPLDSSLLRWTCDPGQFTFQTTAELEDLTEIIGQGRALEALQFGIGIRREGYNLYVLGPPGVGKRSAVEKYLQEKVAGEPTPDDWVYLNRFEDIRRPQAIRLPAGRGIHLRKDIDELIDDLEKAIPAALEATEHKTRIQEATRAEAERQNQAFQALAGKALDQQIQLIHTPGGFALAPLRDGEVLDPEGFHKLPAEEQAQLEQRLGLLQKELEKLVQQVPAWDKETRDRIKEWNREVVRLATGHLLDQLKKQYADLPQVLGYLNTIEQDILERIDEFQPVEETARSPEQERPSFADYEINLLVDNSRTTGAPIIYEDYPSYRNIIGCVEHESHMGALTTDFTLIKAGALHRANGGYLILDALQLLQQSLAWEGLKRALYARSVKLESLGELLSLISTVTLEPEPIPLDTKVILLGDRDLYYMLSEADPDFAELFKVTVDFDDDLSLSPEHCQLYARFLATLARRELKRSLTREAVARVIEHAVREAGNQGKISLHMRTVADILREADFWASRQGSAEIERGHVDRALEQQIYRSDRLHRRIQEEIHEGTILIDTQGTRVGQVNGLSVLEMGNARFGQPTRITATVRLGRGEVIDIEREVKLGGAIHSEGVLILSAFLASRFAQEQPLAVSATLAFEQSYHEVDGDSASVAELVAILSAIAEVPIRQTLAITGSVNQLGQVQPIGGANEKVEGYFDICQRRGLTGEQGVIIPATNVKHLMLRPDVVQAVAEGRFHVYAVNNADQAATLLTGLPAGERDPLSGKYPEGTLNHRIESRLTALARIRTRFTSAESEASVRDSGPGNEAERSVT